MQSRPTALLLAIIAALLAANLIVNLPSQEAKAQPTTHLKVIQFEPGPGHHQGDAARVYRLWSDGVIEWAGWENVNSSCLPADGIAWQEIAETVPLPPGVRITRIYTWRSHPNMLLRLRSDGIVERNFQQNSSDGFAWCGWRTPPE